MLRSESDWIVSLVTSRVDKGRVRDVIESAAQYDPALYDTQYIQHLFSRVQDLLVNNSESHKAILSDADYEYLNACLLTVDEDSRYENERLYLAITCIVSLANESATAVDCMPNFVDRVFSVLGRRCDPEIDCLVCVFFQGLVSGASEFAKPYLKLARIVCGTMAIKSGWCGQDIDKIVGDGFISSGEWEIVSRWISGCNDMIISCAEWLGELDSQARSRRAIA